MAACSNKVSCSVFSDAIQNIVLLPWAVDILSSFHGGGWRIKQVVEKRYNWANAKSVMITNHIKNGGNFWFTGYSPFCCIFSLLLYGLMPLPYVLYFHCAPMSLGGERKHFFTLLCWCLFFTIVQHKVGIHFDRYQRQILLGDNFIICVM